MWVNSPFEQYEIIRIIDIWGRVITNETVYVGLALGLIWVRMRRVYDEGKVIPRMWEILGERIKSFIEDMVSENLGEKGRRQVGLIMSIFMIIWWCNILGMVPYSFTITSHVVITLTLGVSIFTGLTINGIRKHGTEFSKRFIPEGVPAARKAPRVVIEVISYLARPRSLSMRRFANMMSGHSRLKIRAGFGWTMLTMGGLWKIAGLMPVVFIIVVTGLEIGIAFLQAYVFTVLVCIYRKDARDLH